MIITKKKSFEDIINALGPGSVYILGCSQCATLCRTGGETEVLQMKDLLEQQRITVTGYFILDPACHKKNSKHLLRNELQNIEQAEYLLVLACGDGLQVVSSLFPNKHVISGTDTLFLGAEEKRGVFTKRCHLCGTCIAEEFNGICPIGQCPKHMLNGPCGGSMSGYCEVSSEHPCVWEFIIESMVNSGQQKNLKEVIKPHNWMESLVCSVED